MKKAVIKSGNQQFIVKEGDTINIDLIKTDQKTLSFDPLLIIEGEKIQLGMPFIDKLPVTADIIEEDVPQEKVTSIRYKSKKRVRKVRGHRQHKAVIKIKKIT